MIQQLFEHEIETLSGIPEKKAALRKLTFRPDWPVFTMRGGVAYFNDQAGAGFNEKSNDAFVNKVKLFIKKSPFIFWIADHLVASWVGKGPLDALKHAPLDGVVVNLGSGVTAHRRDIVNVDFYPFKNVDLIADITDLPFADLSVDAVISECVLEHVPDAARCVREMYRIVKPGGVVYVVVPFVFSFHSSPHDYRRWSKMGIEQEFHQFEKIDSGIRSGMGAGLNWILAEFFATLFSFGFKKVHQVLFLCFVVLFIPLCFLDYIVRYKTSENIASHVYYIGRKK